MKNDLLFSFDFKGNESFLDYRKPYASICQNTCIQTIGKNSTKQSSHLTHTQ